MKRQLMLTALILTALMSSVYAQNAGEWSHNGGFKGSTTVAFPGEMGIVDSWEAGSIASTAGQAYLQLNYRLSTWALKAKFSVNETTAADALITLDWSSDMAGFIAETDLGLNKDSSALAALKASGLRSWMYLLENQLEVMFGYNTQPDPNDVFKFPEPDDEWVDLGAGGLGSNGSFRLLVRPAAFYGALQFGAVMPVPLASKGETLAFADDFLARTHFFAGFEEGPLLLQGGYWMAPEGDSVESKAALGMSLKNFIIRGITLYERLMAAQLNNWELRGKIENSLGFRGIPVPGTKGLTVSNFTIYVAAAEEVTNTIEASTVIPIGPVSLDPFASYKMTKKTNEIKSSLALTYYVPGLPGSLKTQLKVSEDGIHTNAPKKTPPTVITVAPLVEFAMTLVPNYVGWQTDASVPIMMNLTDRSKDATTAKVQSMLFFNLRSQGTGRDHDWDGADNQLWLLYKLGYDITHNQVAEASLGLAFCIVW